MATATAGAIAVMAGGSRTAKAAIESAAKRPSDISGDDNSTTGSNVQAGAVHNELICMPAAIATSAGISSGTQNAVAANRRSDEAGMSMSASAARFGRQARSTRRMGTAT